MNKPWPSSRRGRVVAVSTAFCIGVASSLSGCATLPSHSDPKAIHSYAPGDSGTTVPGPQKETPPTKCSAGSSRPQLTRRIVTRLLARS